MRAVRTSSDPVSRFAARLLDAPALRLLPALQKEEQALNVLRTSGSQLLPVFTSLGLDVSGGWREPAALVSRAIRDRTEAMMAGEVADLLSTRVALSFAAGGQAPEGAREELRALIGRAAAHRVARIALSGSLVVVRSGIIEKYIPLTRFIVLVRPAAYLLVAPGETVKKDAGYSPLQEHYVQKILSGIASRVPSLPSSLLNLGLRSSIAFTSGGTVEATACRGAIMALRGRALTPALVVDRGADSPDKSWFDVQRRNARWHGLDARMLDELYTIAAENDW